MNDELQKLMRDAMVKLEEMVSNNVPCAGTALELLQYQLPMVAKGQYCNPYGIAQSLWLSGYDGHIPSVVYNDSVQADIDRPVNFFIA